MKGPGYKLTHDVRRTWRCPTCHVERKSPGDVTSFTCPCRDGGTFMVIVVERTVAPRPFQSISEVDVRSSEFGIDDMPVLQPHPSSLPPERTGPRRPRPGSDGNVRQQQEAAAAEPAAPMESTPDAPATEGATSPATDATPPATSSTPPAAPEPAEDEWGEGIL